MTCPECPHERHTDRCWGLVQPDGMNVLCPCSEFYGYSDLDGYDLEHAEGLPAGHGVIARWEQEKEQHEAATLERG